MNSNQWKNYKLDEIAEIIGGGTPSTTNPDFWGDEIPWVTPRDLAGTDERFISRGERCITKKGLQNSSARLLPTGTVLLTTRAPIGYLRIALNPICTNQGFKSLIPKADTADNQFLFYLLKNNVEYLKSVGVGTTFAEISGSTLRQIEFPFPPLPTQRRIADILSALDDKIELNRQTNATLEAIAQAIFKEWFVNFNFPGATGEMNESELGPIPRGWRVGKLGDILEIKGGTTPDTQEEKFWNGQYHWATPKDLSNLSSPILLTTERKITLEGVRQISSGILPAGTLLLSSRAPIGYLAITDMPVSINQGFIAINAQETSNLYILHWLKENMDTVISRANGSTFLEISKSNFREIELIIPDIQTANKFDIAISPIFELIKLNEQKSSGLASMRDKLLPKLMSGEIYV
jgi:type I restriction enzyme S subunit